MKIIDSKGKQEIINRHSRVLLSSSSSRWKGERETFFHADVHSDDERSEGEGDLS